MVKDSPAVILYTFGMGNFPLGQSKIKTTISNALKDGKTVVICSQCYKGNVASEYESGFELRSLGAIIARDMTVEACLAKLSYCLGKGWKGERLKTRMESSLRGELTVPPNIEELKQSGENDKKPKM